MTEDEKKRADDLISNLEMSTGQILLRDKLTMVIVEEMRKNLRALRGVLGVERPH